MASTFEKMIQDFSKKDTTSSDELGAQIFYKKYKREFYWTEKEL